MPDRGFADGSRRIAEAIRAQQAVLEILLPRAAEAGVDDVHRSRVAARRLRSLLRTFGPLLDERRTRLYRVDLRSYARAFTAVREADVISQLILTLARPDRRLKATELQRLTVVLADFREEARDALRRHLQEPGWRALASALMTQSTEGPLLLQTDCSLQDVLRLVAGSWRKSLRLLKKRPESAAALHRLRLALKHCRYALEAVSDVKPRLAAELLRRLRRAQDGIGEHRDALAALRWVGLRDRSLGRATTSRLVARLHEQERLLRKKAARRSAEILPAYEAWRRAVDRVTGAAR